MMKKVISSVLSALLLLTLVFAMTSCGSSEPKYEIVKTIVTFDEYDGTDIVDGTVVVKNTGKTTISLSDGKMVIKDNTDSVNSTYDASPFPAVIQPGESAVYRCSSSKNIDKTVDYKFSVDFTAENYTGECVRFPVSNITTEVGDGCIWVHGKIENPSGVDTKCDVAVFMYDAEHELIFADYTYEIFVPAGVTDDDHFLCSAYATDFDFSKVASCEAIFYPRAAK